MRREIIGAATLYLGDCLEIMAGGGVIPPVDSICTDPPYGIDLQPQRGLTEAIQGDGAKEARELWARSAPLLQGLAKPDTAHLFWYGWSEVWTKAILENAFTVKAEITWAKNMWGMGYYVRPRHENGWYCHLGKPPLPAKAEDSVWEVPKIQAPVHSCEKPVALMARAINFCDQSGRGLILDPFMGVGATGVAALRSGRRFVGIEIDERYFDIACRRMEQAASQADLFIAPAPAPEQKALEV